MHLKGNDNLIYKFASVNEFTFKNLILNKLRFNPPNLMNDQLEGLIKIANIDFKPSNISLNSFIKENRFNKQIVRKHIKASGFIDFYMNYWFSFEIRKFGNSCFSKSPTESLMWAHYADKHAGICLIYDRNLLLDNLSAISPSFELTTIQYGVRPTISLYEEHDQILFESDIPIISTKDLNWKYENEIRFFFRNYEEFMGESFFVGSSPLKGVIYGYHISYEDKDAVSIILKNDPQYIHVREFKEAIDYSTGEIYIQPD